MIKIFHFNRSRLHGSKRFTFMLEEIKVNGRLILLYTLCGVYAQRTFSFIFPSYFEQQFLFESKRLFMYQLDTIIRHFNEANSLAIANLRVVGTGYKSNVARRKCFKVLSLRVGFSAAEIMYKLPDKKLRMRAKKQKIILLGFSRSKLGQIGSQIINLRFTNAYTGKGLRYSSKTPFIKIRKQQQRK